MFFEVRVYKADGTLKKKISRARGALYGSGFRDVIKGPANILETSVSIATGVVRHTTAQTGPTRPRILKSKDSSAVRKSRAMVARLALAVALPMYMTTKYGIRRKKRNCRGMLIRSVI